MTTLTKTAFSAAGIAAIVGLSMFAAGTASAAEDEAKHGQRWRNARHHFVPQEIRENIKANHENLTEDERAALKEEHKAFREEKRGELEAFTGYTREEMREMRKNGEDFGDALLEHGITEDGMRDFMTDSLGDRIDHMVENHGLSSDDELVLRDRLTTFVDESLAKWF